jgi:hydroxymethylpyrimidine/phosphomethylpyrimidine kinase
MTDSRTGEPAKVLTIAGSDSGGAAGLQADLKTFSTLGVYGMSAITAVTAQNSLQVDGVWPVPAEFIVRQIDSVLSDYGANAVKTGFIGSAEAIKAIGQSLKAYKSAASSRIYLVIDPVLVNHLGDSMFPTDVTEAYLDYLFPLADLVTPNLAESQLLAGTQVSSLVTTERAAKIIQAQGPQMVLVKGIRSGSNIVDLLFDGKQARLFRHAYIESANTHGSGDTLSAAICAYLANGMNMTKAIERSREFAYTAILKAVKWRLGAGHGPLSCW